MLLNFQKEINGEQTHFPEKIINGLFNNGYMRQNILDEFLKIEFPFNVSVLRSKKIKLHTIRPDKTNRFKPDVLIDFKQWYARPYWSDNLTFAPRLPVISVQDFEIKYVGKNAVIINIDNKEYYTGNIKTFFNIKIWGLAKNDGFENPTDFFNYFKKDFKGKIIHWTDKKY